MIKKNLIISVVEKLHWIVEIKWFYEKLEIFKIESFCEKRTGALWEDSQRRACKEKRRKRSHNIVEVEREIKVRERERERVERCDKV